MNAKAVLDFIHEVETTTATVEWETLDQRFPESSEEEINTVVEQLENTGKVQIEDVFIQSPERAAQTKIAPISR